MLGDVGVFGPESGQKYVICKISSRNYVFGREGDKSPKSLTNEGEGNVNSVKKLGNIDNKTMLSTCIIEYQYVQKKFLVTLAGITGYYVIPV